MNKIRINQGRFVPLAWRLIFTAFIASAILYAFDRLTMELAIFVAIAISAAVPFVYSSHRILQYNLKTYELSTFVWVAGSKLALHSQKTSPPLRILISEELFEGPKVINERSPRRKRKFKSYLKFSNGAVIFLLSHKELETLNKRLDPIAKKSGIEIVLLT